MIAISQPSVTLGDSTGNDPERRFAVLKENLRFRIILLAAGFLVMLTTLSMPAVAYADDPVPTPNNGNCIVCHENLYFLHDTGNWFCLNESPMTCVDCHGGAPNTLEKDLAHIQRAAHPVINEDVAKCQQCHPEECYDRVALFDASAGISRILVAAPYTPSYSTGFVPAEKTRQEPEVLLVIWEVIPLVLTAGLALTIYIVLRRRHDRPEKMV